MQIWKAVYLCIYKMFFYSFIQPFHAYICFIWWQHNNFLHRKYSVILRKFSWMLSVTFVILPYILMSRKWFLILMEWQLLFSFFTLHFYWWDSLTWQHWLDSGRLEKYLNYNSANFRNKWCNDLNMSGKNITEPMLSICKTLLCVHSVISWRAYISTKTVWMMNDKRRAIVKKISGKAIVQARQSDMCVSACVYEVVLHAGLHYSWGDWLAATSCAKLFLSCNDFTQLSVFIYAQSDWEWRAVFKTKYIFLHMVSISLYCLLNIQLSLMLSSVFQVFTRFTVAVQHSKIRKNVSEFSFCLSFCVCILD